MHWRNMTGTAMCVRYVVLVVDGMSYRVTGGASTSSHVISLSTLLASAIELAQPQARASHQAPAAQQVGLSA